MTNECKEFCYTIMTYMGKVGIDDEVISCASDIANDLYISGDDTYSMIREELEELQISCKKL